MNGSSGSPRERWGGNLGFILATVGSAIGLGNVWRFPYIAGMNGGGAFVLIYLGCVLLIGIPILICEITLGRYTQKSPVAAFRKIQPKPTELVKGFSLLLLLIALLLMLVGKIGLGIVFLFVAVLTFLHGWEVIGWISVLAPFIVLSYYGTVGGWTIAYFIKGLFQQLNFTSVEAAETSFQLFVSNPYWTVSCQLLFMFLCGVTVWFGIRNGIELASKFLLPLLFLLLLVLVVRSLTLPNAQEGVRFLLSPDFSKLTAIGVLDALGHSFYSLSIGLGILLTYGSYLDSDKNIFSSSFLVVTLDTLVSVLAGLAIFPAVFSVGLPPDSGPGLVFQIMPMTFQAIGDAFGWIWCSLFFLLLGIAALTSGISLLEVCVSTLVDQFNFSRSTATFVMMLAISILGILCTISVDNWDKLEFLHRGIISLFGGAYQSVFDTMDKVSCNYLLPIGGLGISIFVGWIWGARHALAELRRGSGSVADVNFFAFLAGFKDDPISSCHSHSFTLAMIWGIFVRFFAPVGIMVVFLHSIGWLNW